MIMVLSYSRTKPTLTVQERVNVVYNRVVPPKEKAPEKLNKRYINTKQLSNDLVFQLAEICSTRII